MTEYSRMAKGSFTATPTQTAAVINLPFQPDFVEVWNYTNIKTSGASLITRAWWDSNFADAATGVSPTLIEGYSSGTVTVFDQIQTNGISTFAAGLALQYGPTKQVIGITKAALARVNVTAHGYVVGDTVLLQGIATTVTNNAFRLLNVVPFTIVAVSDADHFDVEWNTNQSNYTAISGSPTGALVKKVLYPFLYLPGDNVVSAVTTGAAQTVITTTMYHNLELGQEVAFRVLPFWGMTQLNSLPNVLIPGSPIYGYVTAITGVVNGITLDNWNVAVNINSTNFTAFNTNQATIPTSITPAQIVAVGDINTGGVSIGAYDTTTLYPSPAFPIPNNRFPTINGPAIKGSFVNNTEQGFIIGPGAPSVITGTTIVTASSQVIWRAFLHDIARP
jgi:hypothetical protein